MTKTTLLNPSSSTLLHPIGHKQLSAPVLELFHNNTPREILAAQTPFLIGRDNPEADLSVTSEFASRRHCQIEFHEGKFVLHDFSRNGTVIKLGIAPSFRLKSEMTPLAGSGRICLGQETEIMSECILFKVSMRSL